MVAAGFALAAMVLGACVWLLGARQLSGCFADACGATCANTSPGFPFSIVRYLGALFCRLYDPSFVTFFRRFFVLVGPVHMATIALYFAATLSLLVGPRGVKSWSIADLRQRVSDFLVILLLGSTLLTLTALTELTLWGWFAEIAQGWAEVAALRSLQIGSALYWGMCNSALMLLVFAPIALLLARQARALAQLHNAGAPLAALEAWEREHGITLHGRALWAQLGGILAPLLPARSRSCSRSPPARDSLVGRQRLEMSMTDLMIRCACGGITGIASGLSRRTGNRVVCYCDDCQAFARHLGHPERVLDAHGGTDIVQTSPARVRFESGADRLACLRLTEKGVLRWYARCCATPIGNTAATPRLPFVGLIHSCLVDTTDGTPRDEVLGPVRGRVQLAFATGDTTALQASKGHLLPMVLHFIRIMAAAWWRGDQRRSPFFDRGAPVVTPQPLSEEERRAAYQA